MAMEKEQKTNNIPKLKIILLGDSGVGKTSLINQYVNKKFQNKSTYDFENAIFKALKVDGKHVLLEIQDTRGQERYGGLDAAFFSNAKGCMLVYDVNDPKSFDNLENWHNQFCTRVIPHPIGPKNSPFIVLGNKDDIDGGNNKEISRERARNWCANKGIHNMLTSAKDNKYVDDAFQYIAQLALEQETKNFDNNNGNAKPQRPQRKEEGPIHPLNKQSNVSNLESVHQKPNGDASKPANNYQSIPIDVPTNNPLHNSQNTNNPPHKPPPNHKPYSPPSIPTKNKPPHKPPPNQPPHNASKPQASCCTIL